MIEQLCGSIERRFGDQGDEIVDADVPLDRLVEAAHALGGHPLAAGMRIDNDCVASRDHAHSVASDRRQRVGDGSDRADDAEGGVLDHGEAMVAAENFTGEKFNSRRAFAEHLQFLNFVFQPTDFRLFKLHPAEFDGIVNRDATDVGDRLAAPLQPQFFQLLKGLLRGPHRLVNAGEDAMPPGERNRCNRAQTLRRGAGRAGAAQFRNHLLDDGADVLGSVDGGLGHGFLQLSCSVREKTLRPSIRTVSTRPMTTASIGRDLVSGVSRALEP